MSSLIVEVCKVDNVEKHPQADRLRIYTVKGWKVVSSDLEDGSPRYNVGDRCVYFPPDSVMPKELADSEGITKYLTPVINGEDASKPSGFRVRVARLRAFPSYGYIMTPRDDSPVGTDMADKLGITKWEPPLVCNDGDAERAHHSFHEYTDIEHYSNFPDLIQDGEEVVFTEKCHGQNTRVGVIWTPDESGEIHVEYMAGSHAVRRKQFGKDGKECKFWKALNTQVRSMLSETANAEPVKGSPRNVIAFFELYGSGVQDMTYGKANGAFDFLAYDIAVNMQYLDFDDKVALFKRHEIPMVPVLYRGPFSREVVGQHVSGLTTICPPEKNCSKFKGREGIVITPVKERPGVSQDKIFSRTILKAVSFEYSERKHGTEYH